MPLVSGVEQVTVRFMTMQMERRSDVFVLNLGDGENRFNPTWVDEIESALAEVSATPGPRALVTTGSGKFWSNGLDLEWMASHSEAAIESLEN